MDIFVFPSGPLETNAILIGCPVTRKAALIDPAIGSTEKVLKQAKESNLSIEKILLTHSHWDHFGDAHLLKEKTGASLYVHPLDAKNLEEPGSDRLPLFVPIHPVHPDHLMQEGDIIEVGTLKLEVIHTPGHCPGSVCFYLRDQKTLLSGDTLFRGTIGNLHLPTGEPEKMWPSLEKLARLPLDTRVIPGHGKETTLAKEDWLRDNRF